MRSVIVLLSLFLTDPTQENKSSGLATLAQIPQVSLERLLADPEEYLGLRVQIKVSLGEEMQVSNPYFTRFNSAHYFRFSARSDSKPIWESLLSERPFEQLFISKSSSQLSVLRSAKLHQRAELTVVIRDTFRGLAWIEIEKVKLLPEWTPEGTLIAVARAQKLWKEGQLSLAIEEFQSAVVDPLPALEKAALFQQLGTLYQEKEDFKKSAEYFDRAKQLNSPTKQ